MIASDWIQWSRQDHITFHFNSLWLLHQPKTWSCPGHHRDFNSLWLLPGGRPGRSRQDINPRFQFFMIASWGLWASDRRHTNLFQFFMIASSSWNALFQLDRNQFQFFMIASCWSLWGDVMSSKLISILYDCFRGKNWTTREKNRDFNSLWLLLNIASDLSVLSGSGI